MAPKPKTMAPFLALIMPVESPAEPPPGEQPPLEIWGGSNEPFPTPPIFLPPGWNLPPINLPPLGIWGGSNEPFPTPPIVIPPPDLGGRPPLEIWGGSNEPFPTPPIYLPPTDKLPPIVIIPPIPDPIPKPPAPPEVADGAKVILVWNDGWDYKVIPPPAFVKPPGVGIPKGKR